MDYGHTHAHTHTHTTHTYTHTHTHTHLLIIILTYNASYSGGSRIFERGVQVQADYGNSMHCFIMAGEYVYAEAAKSEPIRAKRRKFRNLGPLRLHLLAFQAP